MKVAPLYHALVGEDWCEPVLVHTGQHYDESLSDVFLREFGLPRPDVNLEVGSGTHAEQTAAIMVAYERLCLERPPDWIVVVGDVNSTLACTVAAKKLCLRVAHLEAGLRSFDPSMPEEINRIVTDRLADLLWTPSEDADENLLGEGVAADRIERVGNIMLDCYELMRPAIESAGLREKLGLAGRDYAVATFHRPANVDERDVLARLVDGLATIARELPVVFPVHPRTRARLERFGLTEKLGEAEGLLLLEPQGYVEFMNLVSGCRLAITDSGGIQEETTYLGIPCQTVRTTTERPITVSLGTNTLVAVRDLVASAQHILRDGKQTGSRPPLWDGHTAERVVNSLCARRTPFDREDTRRPGPATKDLA